MVYLDETLVMERWHHLSHATRSWQELFKISIFILSYSVARQSSQYSEEQLKPFVSVAQRITNQEPVILPLDDSSVTRAHELGLYIQLQQPVPLTNC